MKLKSEEFRTEFLPKGKPYLEKCYLLPDWAFVSAIRTVGVIRWGNADSAASRWDVATVIAGHPEKLIPNGCTDEWPGVPPRLIMAKARALIKRGIITGCACGCRGDFQVVHQ